MFPFARIWIKSFLKNDDGLTAMDYSLAAAFIAAAVIGSFSVLGPEISQRFGKTFEPRMLTGEVAGECIKVNKLGICVARKSQGQGKGVS